MLIDHRTYTVRPGGMARHLAIYEQYGLAVQTRHLGEPLAYLVTETGPLNTYVHLWVYEDAADRARKRAMLFADPEWLDYMARSAEAGLLEKQETKLMTPASFAPLKR